MFNGWNAGRYMKIIIVFPIYFKLKKLCFRDIGYQSCAFANYLKTKWMTKTYKRGTTEQWAKTSTKCYYLLIKQAQKT